MQTVIELDDIWKVFDRARTHVALEGVSLAVHDREFVSLIGPSGCGKTTILRMVADLVPPTQGTIKVNGRQPAAAREERQFGFVFQAPVLLPWRTVLENVGLPLEVLAWSKRDRETRCRELLDLVGLAKFEHYFPDELSGGMQQRVAIARALSFDPAILLMDEPFGALDLITRDRMSIELLKIWERTQKTVLFVTHSVSEAVFLSDRVLVFSTSPGRIIADVRIDLGRPRTTAVRDGDEFIAYERRLRAMLE